MISRYLGGRASLARAALTVTLLFSTAVWAQGPRYTYIGASYEWTDVKYAVDPSQDPNFNNGSIEGVNIDASFGILGWMHILGQYFNGNCEGCGNWVNNQTNQVVRYDPGFKGYKVGLGANLGFDMIGLNDRTDLILRANYVDVDLTNVSKEDGWSVEATVRSQISDRAEVYIGFERTELSTVSNNDMLVGLGYEVWEGLTLTADAIVFDTETGFSLGLRWYFGNLLYGNRDSIVR